ncbi:MAG: phospholipase [Caulobacteraceae bacterium]|nr:phospholipase [Caulobacteraceae bacterium]
MLKPRPYRASGLVLPRNADLPGEFLYRVTPVLMAASGDLSYGIPQTAAIALARETYPGEANVAFTRGFISSQAFVDRYLDDGPLQTLIPPDAKTGLSFSPTHKDATDAYDWMGFEARREILALLDEAISDPAAKVGVVGFDLNLPEVLDRLKSLRARARVIIDDSADHHGNGAAEDGAERQLIGAGVAVKRQHMGSLQHNKTIFVDGTSVQRVVCGSTNMSWRGFFVQSNNALTVTGKAAVDIFAAAFESYWNAPASFKASPSAEWMSLGLNSLDAQISFSPHGAGNSVLKSIADDIRTARSSIFYSLAFLAITPGAIRDVLFAQADRPDLFVSGISDKRAGVEVASGNSNRPPTYVAALDKNAPRPFRDEPTGLAGGGGGTRMHHKFIVIDFDKPGARVYLGSYNMSKAADGLNGENLVLIRDRRVATSYMIEAVRMIDHYEFRVAHAAAARARTDLKLQPPPANPGEKPWRDEDYADPAKIKDRELFA